MSDLRSPSVRSISPSLPSASGSLLFDIEAPDLASPRVVSHEHEMENASGSAHSLLHSPFAEDEADRHDSGLDRMGLEPLGIQTCSPPTPSSHLSDDTCTKVAASDGCADLSVATYVKESDHYVRTRGPLLRSMDDPYASLRHDLKSITTSSRSFLAGTLQLSRANESSHARDARADDELAEGIAAVEALLTAAKNAMSRMYVVEGTRTNRFRTHTYRRSDRYDYPLGFAFRAWAEIRLKWNRSRRRRRSLPATKQPWFLWRTMSTCFGLIKAPTRVHAVVHAGAVLLMLSAAVLISRSYSSPAARMEEDVEYPIWRALRAEQ